MRLVDEGKFRELFVEELLWDRPDHEALDIEIEGATYRLEQVAGFAGLRVWLCRSLPDRRTQRLIDKHVRRNSTERFLIFTDGKTQAWRWLQSQDAQGSGQPRLVTHLHKVGAPNEALDQRLEMISIGFSEQLTVVEVLQKMRRAFDAEQVTRRFYSDFLSQQQSLKASIAGIPDGEDAAWYAALMMNRLMFIYFMQRKGFMADDQNYLRNRLEKLRNLAAGGNFYSYYRDFLLPLFHEGLGQKSPTFADEAIRELVGDVRYINGGIFSHHELERSHDIDIPDESFEGIFRLFDSYQWHLDDREGGNPNEINPDVLGYIFEQFINQKQMGAFYTKEDVTGFMTGSAILPIVLDYLSSLGVDVYAPLADEPERYIWQGNFFGVGEGFPQAIESERGQAKRPTWGAYAANSVGLPGESWWEVDFRRTELERRVKALRAGLVTSADEAVTQNLDLETLAVDAIDSIKDPGLIFNVWKHLSGLRVVDPTCGSGAFLFAALKVLIRLYSTVLDAAQASDLKGHEQLAALVKDIETNHPNSDYFLLKHASLSNLYGVDIMKEAVEVARLRLFLKIVSAIEDKDMLEPLPDLDFNIKCGNILVGAYSAEDLEEASGANLFASEHVERVMESVGRVAEKTREFRDAQERNDDIEVRQIRTELLDVTQSARNDADRQYFAILDHNLDFETWVETHQPFHWFVEFQDVFQDGGFDVVIGNPPYIARTKVTDYTYKGFKTNALSDIYAPCTERAAQITREGGRFALIVPISSCYADEFLPLRKVLKDRFNKLWISNFSRNPAALFASTVGVRSTILVGARSVGDASIHMTRTHRWEDPYRPALFETLTYFELPTSVEKKFGWVRLPSSEFASVLSSSLLTSGNLAAMERPRSEHSIGFKTTALYWLSVFINDPPAYHRDTLQPFPQSKVGRLRVENERAALLTLAVASSKLCFLWWGATGDDLDLTATGLKSTPVDPTRLSDDAQEKLVEAARELVADFPNHIMFTPYAGKWMGNYVLSEQRDITDRIDDVLAEELGFGEHRSAIEYAYSFIYKPTGDRPGTRRDDPSLAH